MIITRQEAERKLKQIFKISEFYGTQWIVVDKILKGQRVLLIEKTGFGKSLCYQFPATQFEGTTVIFSPLIALMRDQVQKLQSLGINAKCINSNQSDEENSQIIQEAKQNKIKMLYIAPERMENAEWLHTARTMKLSMVVVDEAHCISVWGHDFRPAFRRIINLINFLPIHFPVLATTATATKRVEEDIKVQIGKNITSVRGNLLRPNLHLRVVKVDSEDEKRIWLGENMHRINGTGIVYTGTRVNTEIYTKWFEYFKISAIAYNAGFDADSRKTIEQGLLNNAYKCVVSTNALGMGIDKPDIRFIIHTQIPVSPVHYYQEIGRAGRDGKPSLIILFYNPKEDVTLPLSFIEEDRPAPEKYQRVIDALKSERLGQHGIIKKANLKQIQMRVILADLMEQGIINEVLESKNKKYEYKFNAPQLNTTAFEALRQAKLKDLNEMISYAETDQCRMKFLCDFLGDSLNENCKKCDNDTGRCIQISVTKEWTQKLEDFQQAYFPILDVQTTRTNLVTGVAASYYGFSNVGQAIHRCKYENGGDFPDWLLKLTLKAYRKYYGNEKFDLVLYVPPTESGGLVKNFAEKVAKALKFSFSHRLRKTRQTKSQKSFQSSISKSDNIKDAFEYVPADDIRGKSILLIDDIFDSGATIKEIGKHLTKLGATKIAPIVIAKTVGGDI